MRTNENKYLSNAVDLHTYTHTHTKENPFQNPVYRYRRRRKDVGTYDKKAFITK